jgi:hypothetical protein
MKNMVALLFASLATFLFMPNTQIARAANYISGLPSNCISQFYNPQNYNWLTFQNNCGQAVSITYTGITAPRNGQLDLGIGKKGGPGETASEVAKHGGFYLYVCPLNAIPVDSSTHKYVQHPNLSFVCQK